MGKRETRMKGQEAAPGDTDKGGCAPVKRGRLQRRPEVEVAPAASSASARPQGRLSEPDIAMLCAAYASGATGELLIGLRQRVRVCTVMLPMQPNEQLAVAQMQRAGRQLRALRCDGRLYARRARLLGDAGKSHDALVIDSLEKGSRDQQVLLLDGTARRWRLREHFLEDAVTHTLSNIVMEA